ncbi:type II secretion system protein F [Pseudomonas sp. WN033]|nr:type II secretion system protein F [Pseudomonas sp. WN033]
MNMPLLLALALLSLGLLVLRRGLRQAGSERVVQRLDSGQGELARRPVGWLKRTFIRAGLSPSPWALLLVLVVWLLVLLLSYGLGGWPGLLPGVLIPLVGLRLYVGWRYQRRVRRMIEQTPQFLDHVIRSLKSGRTLGDGMLLAMQAAQPPLNEALARTRRNIQRGVPLGEAMDDFAHLYERDEFRILAMGVWVNQRYGGNASELLDNLISMIRDRERAARQLRALTGETRVSALVLGCLPVAMAGYIFITNPDFLLGMWQDPGGRLALLLAFVLQALGCLLLWRMMRSI